MTKTMIGLMLAVLCIFMMGCDKKTEGEKVMKTYTVEEEYKRSLDSKEYLMEVYGLSEEQIKGLNVESVEKLLNFRERKMTLEDIDRYIKAFDFHDDNYQDTYLILTALTNKKIPLGTKVKKIGYHVNPGTAVLDAVFDLENKVFYVNDYTLHVDDYKPNPLVEDLTGVVDDYKVYEWDTECMGEYDEHTTGTYAYKLVFLGEDDHKYVYEGFEMETSTIPNEYWELSRKLNEIIDTRERRVIE